MGTLVKYIELFPIPMMKTKTKNNTKVIGNNNNDYQDEDSPLINMNNSNNKGLNHNQVKKQYYNKHSYLHENSIFISLLKNDNEGRSRR